MRKCTKCHGNPSDSSDIWHFTQNHKHEEKSGNPQSDYPLGLNVMEIHLGAEEGWKYSPKWVGVTLGWMRSELGWNNIWSKHEQKNIWNIWTTLLEPCGHRIPVAVQLVESLPHMNMRCTWFVVVWCRLSFCGLRDWGWSRSFRACCRRPSQAGSPMGGISLEKD